MKNSKKILAVVMAVLTLSFCTLFSAGALTFFGIEIGEEEKEESDLKWLSYTNGQNDVNCIYAPPATLVAENGYVVITDEKPLAFDYEFLYWQDEGGNIFYPGEEYYVTGLDQLGAVWTPKQDNDIKVVRIVKTALEALIRIFTHLRYYSSFIEDYSIEHATDYLTTTTEEPTTEPPVTAPPITATTALDA